MVLEFTKPLFEESILSVKPYIRNIAFNTFQKAYKLSAFKSLHWPRLEPLFEGQIPSVMILPLSQLVYGRSIALTTSLDVYTFRGNL